MNRTVLKMLLMLFMTMDHIAYRFLSIYSPGYQVMRFFGRSVAITMCYLLVEGFAFTKNRKRYVLRLLIFAIIAYFPYILMGNPLLNDENWYLDFNMLFNLTNCFILLIALEKLQGKPNIYKFIAICISCAIGYYCDWLVFAPLWVANFYLNKDKRQDIGTVLICLSSIVYSLISSYPYLNNLFLDFKIHAFCIGIFLFFWYRKLYNHQNGKYKLKYFFYIYYPLHITIIDIIYLMKITHRI